MRTFSCNNKMMIMLTALAVLGASRPVAARTYTIDPVHSSVVFKISHLGVSQFYGRFNNPAGILEFDEQQPEKSRIEVTVMSKEIDTANEKRDTHLKSPDFFNIDVYPAIRFVSRQVQKAAERNYLVSGELTFLGVTKPLVVTGTYVGAGKDPWGGNRIGFETAFTIRRSDFGMNFMPESLGDEVEIIVGIEGMGK
ncbi:MAG: YceI family protein [Thermodesulfobacteriota bacterium]